MAKLSDKKIIDKIYSDLKGINTAINKYGDLQIFTSENGKICLLLGDLPFSILTAEIKFENEFTEWLKNKKVILPIDDFKKVVKCLKKNRQDIDFDENQFIFGMVDAEGSSDSVIVKTVTALPGESRLEKVDLIEKTLKTKVELSEEVFNQTVFAFFDEKEKIKVLEIPSKNIDSLLKNFIHVEIAYSELDPKTEHRFVSLSSSTDALTMIEYFATV